MAGREQVLVQGVLAFTAAGARFFEMPCILKQAHAWDEVACVEGDTYRITEHDGAISKELLRQTTVLKRVDGQWLMAHVWCSGSGAAAHQARSARMPPTWYRSGGRRCSRSVLSSRWDPPQPFAVQIAWASIACEEPYPVAAVSCRLEHLFVR